MPEAPRVNSNVMFGYEIASGDLYLGHAYVIERKTAPSRGGLIDVKPDYGFRILLDDGTQVADIAAGYWPFAKAVLEATIPFHSPACDEDSKTAMGGFDISPGGGEPNE